MVLTRVSLQMEPKRTAFSSGHPPHPVIALIPPWPFMITVIGSSQLAQQLKDSNQLHRQSLCRLSMRLGRSSIRKLRRHPGFFRILLRPKNIPIVVLGHRSQMLTRCVQMMPCRLQMCLACHVKHLPEHQNLHRQTSLVDSTFVRQEASSVCPKRTPRQQAENRSAEPGSQP